MFQENDWRFDGNRYVTHLRSGTQNMCFFYLDFRSYLEANDSNRFYFL